jgi:DNA polymerase-1
VTADAKGPVPEDPRSAAAHYLGRGYIPVPVPRQGRRKAPTLKGWQNLRPAPGDLAMLFPDGQCNVGLLTGAPSNGLLDVDLDTREAVTAGSLLLPRTGWIFGRQGKPRSHWLYHVEDPPDKAQDPYRDLDGRMIVEVHSTRWQVVVPPSVHETGEAVCWHTCTEPARVDLAALQTAVRVTAACALLGRHWPDQGSRQDCFLALAGGLLRAGWAQLRVEQFVHALAAVTRDEESRKRVQTVVQTAHKLDQQKAVTGWPKLAELIGAGEEVVRRARRWLGVVAGEGAVATRAPRYRPLPKFSPLPTRCLPPVLSEMVQASAQAIGCDPALVALPALSVAAGCVGNARVLLLKRGWTEPSVLWSLTVAESGGHKSPAYHAAVGPLMDLQMDLYDQHQEDHRDYQEALEQWQAQPKDERGDKPSEPPEPPTFVTSDATIEALGQLLEDRPKGMLLARDELDAWFKSFTRYKGKGGGTDRPQWLELHRAGTLRIDRLTRERPRIAVRRAAVSITGTIQPAVLAGAFDEDSLHAGLGARFLLAMPTRRKRVWSEAELPDEVVVRYQRLLQALLDLPLVDTRKRKPHVLGLSLPARRLWIDFYNEWAEEQFQAEGEQASAFAKIEAYASRLILLHHVVSHVSADADDCRPITETSARAGIDLARWFAAEAVRIYAMLRESKEERETRRLAEWVGEHGGRVTVRQLQKSNARKWPTSDLAEAALEGLVAGGLGCWEEGASPERGGHTPKWFRLLVQTSDASDTRPAADRGEDGRASDARADTRPSVAPPQAILDDTAPFPEGTCGTDAGDAPWRASEVSDVCAEDPTAAVAGSTQGIPGRVSDPRRVPHRVVRNPEDLAMVLAAVDESVRVGLDVETLGLDPRHDRVRLLALDCDTNDGGRFTYLIDCFAVDPTALFETLAGKELVIHNAAFDLGFLARLGFTPAAKVHDTMLLTHLLTAGTGERVTLAACCQRYLGLALDKTEQKSDWSGELTPEQLAYAAHDAAVLAPLLQALTAEIRGAGPAGVADAECRALPSVVWMGQQGVAFDRDRWLAQAGASGEEADRLRWELDQAAPPRPDGALFAQPWNWDSPAQVKEVLALAGCPVEDTADGTLAAIAHPLAQVLRRYRAAAKKVSVYGPVWLKHVAPDGRVYPSWKQLGAVTGRMSCSGPNMQQLPRGEVRRCVVAPPGRALVKADWSQLHLRIIAGVAPEPAMQAAFRDGQDLHTLTARRLTGKEEVSKEERQRAKAAAFGLCYGMGAERFRAYALADYGLDLSAAEAASLRRGFFRAYPGLRSWHRRQPEGAVTVKAPSGRACRGVKKFSDKLAYAILLLEADCLKTALALLWERRGQAPGAFPVLACHDELVVECDLEQADRVEEWLVAIMLEAAVPFLAPVPVEVCASIGTTWGGGEVRPEKTHRRGG